MILFRRPQTHRQPTQAQKEAGNYAMERRTFQGLPITIETPRGALRTGVDRDGKAWSSPMDHDYGYIRGTQGVDGDHFDVLIGPHEEAPTVYLVTTMAPPEFTRTDEQKALLGFMTEAEAYRAFMGMYDNPKFLGRMVAVPVEAFREAVGTTQQQPRILFRNR